MAVARTLLGALECDGCELSILITGDSEIRRLNRDYRKKDKATDVLSFPAGDDLASGILGDVVISIDTALRQAKEYGVSPIDEVSRLLIHGTLHLLGYDHEKVPRKEADRMRRAERRLLRLLEPTELERQ